MIDYLSILKLIFNNTNTVALVLSNFNTYILCLLIVLTMMVISANTYSLNQMDIQNKIVAFNGLVIILLFISIIVSTAYDYTQNTSYIGKENKEYATTLYKTINNQTNTNKTAYKEVQFELKTIDKSLKSYNVTSLNNLLSNIDYLSTYYDTHNIEDNKYDFINKTLNTFYKTAEVPTESILPELLPNLKNYINTLELPKSE